MTKNHILSQVFLLIVVLMHVNSTVGTWCPIQNGEEEENSTSYCVVRGVLGGKMMEVLGATEENVAWGTEFILR